MGDTVTKKRRLLLKAELVVLVVVVCIWVVKSTTIDIDRIEAGSFRQIVKINPDNTHLLNVQSRTAQSLRQVRQRTLPESHRITPMDVLEDDIAAGKRQIVQWFEGMRVQLDQKQLPTQEYLQAIDQLRAEAQLKELKLMQQTEAKAQSMNTIISLMEEGALSPLAGKRALWRIAGLDDEVIDAMLPETKPID